MTVSRSRSRVAQYLAAVALAFSTTGYSPAASRAVIVFQHGTVVDVATGNLLPDQTIVVNGNRIQTVGPAASAKIPAGARVVDVRGKYLIPGLWDMHAHTEIVAGLFGGPSNSDKDQEVNYRKAYQRYIANGVTGIREMAQRAVSKDFFLERQREVMAGAMIGPRAVGPSADLSYNIQLNTPDDARRIVDSLKAAGDAFVKYHDPQGDREVFFALLGEARKVGLPVVGHLPSDVTLPEAVDSGMTSVEHVAEHRPCYPEPSEATCAPLAEAYRRTNAWMAPTASAYYYYKHDSIAGHRKLVRFLHDNGVRKFLAGSDCEPYVLRYVKGLDYVCHYGFAVLQEVIFFGESGLTPLEALQTATLNPALFFNATDSLGTIGPGKLADFVVLDDNPLTSIRNILKIHAVVANGRYFDRAALDALDPNAIKLAKLYEFSEPPLEKEPPFDELEESSAGTPAIPATPTP